MDVFSSDAQRRAFSAVLLERRYQDKRWADSPSKGHHETGAYLSFIQSYLSQAMDEIIADDYLGLDSVRKIAALAVACMEDNGIAWREEEFS